MRNTFISGFTVFSLLFTAATFVASAQDSLKKPVARKPMVVAPGMAKPAYVNPNAKFHHYYYRKPAVPVTPGAAAATDTTHHANPYAYHAATAADSALLKDKSLNGQYQYLLTKVYKYQQPFVAALWKTVSDTLKANHKKLADAEGKSAAQAKTIAALQADEAAKAQITAQADDISMFGIVLAKATYNVIMWSIVIVLAIIAIIVIARSGKLKYDANYRTNLYNELEEEFKTYKTKANDKEKKLARELQTERNKVDELMGRE